MAEAAHAVVAALRGVSFWYPGLPDDQPALDGLDLSFRAGQVVLVCGPSGSGKSTLLRLLLGLVPQLSGGRLAGEVEVLGCDPTRFPPHAVAASGVGLLFQNPTEGFVAERVADEVAFGPENLGIPPEEIEARIAEALASVGLAGFERRRLRELSTGEQQRVALAAALALRPRLLLLDEPTAHLDEAGAGAVLQLVVDVARARGATLLLAEHRLGLAAPLADEVLVLVGGRALLRGEPRAILANPQLPALGVPVPRVSQVAVALGLGAPLPLTADELAERVRARARPVGTGTRPSLSPAGERSSRPALVFDSVSFRYPSAGLDALCEVSYTIEPGEITVLMGSSGAGKSTLARLALGLLQPTSGTVRLNGLPTDRTPFSLLARHGGLVLQNPVLQLLAETVEAELRLGLRDVPESDARTRIEALLETFGLGNWRRQHPLALSDGQRRRVALAAVLARQPRLLVLDEPTLGQDETYRSRLVDLVLELASRGTALLCITHDREFASDVAQRVLVLREGRLEADVVGGDIAQLEAAGVPLGDVAAVLRRLDAAGAASTVRSVPELVEWLG